MPTLTCTSQKAGRHSCVLCHTGSGTCGSISADGSGPRRPASGRYCTSGDSSAVLGVSAVHPQVTLAQQSTGMTWRATWLGTPQHSSNLICAAMGLFGHRGLCWSLPATWHRDRRGHASPYSPSVPCAAAPAPCLGKGIRRILHRQRRAGTARWRGTAGGNRGPVAASGVQRLAQGWGPGVGAHQEFSWMQSLSCRHVSPYNSGSSSVFWHSRHPAMRTRALSAQAWQRGNTCSWQRRIRSENALHSPSSSEIRCFFSGRDGTRSGLARALRCAAGRWVEGLSCGPEASKTSAPFLAFTSGASSGAASSIQRYSGPERHGHALCATAPHTVMSQRQLGCW